ncbi:MAG TPA: hypothetical protein VK762_16525 [Polyangiaceae bacterium]|jgi:hypothetical protein|nr:hypothetical protein [Polyangiaceae bacterium]
MRTLQTLAKRASCTLGLAAVLGTAVVGCGGGDDNPYKPQPAWSGKAASLPAPPTLPSTPLKNGDAYTVYGAVHQLRSMMHAKDVTSPPAISIVGYIVDSNIPRAPDCAIHKTGKADPEGCTPEVPSFWIADNKDDTKGLKVRVVGWARNFAVIYDAMQMYKKVKPGEQPTDKQVVTDDMLNVPLPFPLPAVGAQVKITGAYNVAKTVVSDMVSEPTGGVMALQKVDTLQPAPEPAKFAKPIP